MDILLVENDPLQANVFENAIRNLDREICKVRDGQHAVQFLRTQRVELVVLDWHLPSMSGLEVLRWIRANLGDEPTVLFLTARVLEADVVAALDAGADEYIVKPFREIELAARVKALLRRYGHGRKQADLTRVGAYVLDPTMKSVSLRDETVDLTEKEFALAKCLFDNVGRVISRDTLEALAWGRPLDGSSRSLDTHVYRLRQKLTLRPENGFRLSAVYTHGYRLDEVDGASPAASRESGQREMPKEANSVVKPEAVHAA
ncbi:response regulator transcription factor [Burkholderia sp. Se-20378]|uniref:response regulator transcription factor n=1 Tax=Burkholderia sp. Se-20378 TaxID=2703899 RepID=UPI0019812E00|nr:response regulator transcription factor [Burkholderia sp. Se-20378]MBN3772384.1 response regulator transcription factor [Burkholderia sp. Se-20378]